MRHRALVLLLRDELQLATSDGYMLHVGPAESIRRWLERAPKLRYLAVDLTSPLADVLADVTNLPMEDESFDMVLCIHVLEHVLDDRAAIREIHRVLKPGGLAVLQVPPSAYEVTLEDPNLTTPEERERVFGQFDHVRICGADYGGRLLEAGFEVEEVDYVEKLPEEERRLYGLRTGEPFFLCRKSGRPD
jgi:SAM-dependent methyltransferase